MSESTLPAYLIARLKVKDHKDYFERYAAGVAGMLDKYGGEPVVACPTPETVEGEWDSNWTVVLRFPDMQRAKAWYHSEEYKPLLDLRLNELTDDGGAAVFVEGFDPSVFRL